jgi:hypothetical protein
VDLKLSAVAIMAHLDRLGRHLAPPHLPSQQQQPASAHAQSTGKKEKSAIRQNVNSCHKENWQLHSLIEKWYISCISYVTSACLRSVLQSSIDQRSI